MYCECILLFTLNTVTIATLPSTTTVDGLCDINCFSCSNNGKCNECLPRYFQRDGNCLQCIDDCIVCTNRTSCFKCLEGYYYDSNSYLCKSCDYRCTHCVSNYNKCSACKSEYYGKSCQNLCGLCENGQCSKEECLFGCRNGYYRGGDGGCNKCSLCKHGICSNDNCTLGCNTGFFADPDVGCHKCQPLCFSCSKLHVCDQCLPGLWGHNCSKYCNNCKNDICDMNTGICTGGCKNGFYLNSNTCSPCQSGCKSCTSALSCETCEHGKWGTRCQSVCGNCRGNTCNKSTGVCDYGCNYGRYGERCQHNCDSPCISCVSDVNCTSCIDGRYGERCQNVCDAKCKVCYGSSTNCIQCFEEDYLHNSYCYQCPSNFYFYHNQCHPCPSQCLNCSSQFSCNKCVDSYFGETCNATCEEGYFSYGQLCFNCLEKCKDNTTCEPSEGRGNNVACQQECVDNYRYKLCGEGRQEDTDGGYSNPYIYAGVGGALAILSIVVALVVAVTYTRRRNNTASSKQNSDLPGDNLGINMDIEIREIELSNDYDIHHYEAIDDDVGDMNERHANKCGDTNISSDHAIYNEGSLYTEIDLPSNNDAPMSEIIDGVDRDKSGDHDIDCDDTKTDIYLNPIYNDDADLRMAEEFHPTERMQEQINDDGNTSE